MVRYKNYADLLDRFFIPNSDDSQSFIGQKGPRLLYMTFKGKSGSPIVTIRSSSVPKPSAAKAPMDGADSTDNVALVFKREAEGGYQLMEGKVGRWNIKTLDEARLAAVVDGIMQRHKNAEWVPSSSGMRLI